VTTREIADRLVALCRAGKFTEAINELYAPDVQQYENGDQVPGGRAALVQACQGWLDSRVVHGTEFLGTHVGPDSFVVEMRYDVTPHATKQRHQWSEAAVYRVRDGKIADARFYYKPPAA
jgi:ketosteroid isomerase-like protein